VKGDCEGLYALLDSLKAQECGQSVAAFQFRFKDDPSGAKRRRRKAGSEAPNCNWTATNGFDELDCSRSRCQRTCSRTWRAGDAARTRDIFLGKEVLYQLSYTRDFSKRGRNDASGARRIK
jgi:hypothetical protein